MDKINEQIYNANVELVDRNRILDADNKILKRRIEKTIEYLENNNILKELIQDEKAKKELLEILKGEDYGLAE